MTSNLPTTLDLNRPATDLNAWLLDPEVVFLNHGSFGSCPRPVLEFQNQLRARLERHPVHFLVHELDGLLDAARAALAGFVGADAEDLVFVPSATAGVNTVLRSLEFQRDDELLVTDQEYNACRNALDYAANRAGARVVVAKVPFPVSGADDIIQAILAAVTPRTRLALVDHVTSQTGMVLPVARLAEALAARGVDLLVDGAHAPGMVPLNLHQLGAAYYTGNCHKWLCAPKGSALLHVRRDRQKLIRPLVISHGANSRRQDRSRFQIEFSWTGTWDPSAFLSVPEALRFMGGLLPGGWPAVMARNHALALAARKLLCGELGVTEPCPAELIGSMASIPISDSPAGAPPVLPVNEYALSTLLREQHRIEVPVIPWPAPPKRLLRFSAQLYNSLPQYDLLATTVARELAAGN